MAQTRIRISVYRVAFALFAMALFQAGCERAKPTTYRIPKEERASPTELVSEPAQPAPGSGAPAGMQVLPGMEQAANEAGGLTYSVPEDWEEFAARSPRKANFRVTDSSGSAEITVLVFPGDVGGDLANVNRWAGQLGLQPIRQSGLAEVSEPYSVSNHRALLVRLEGPTESILGALLPFHDFTWFFKMQGGAATVAEQEAAMRDFLDSVQLADDAH